MGIPQSATATNLQQSPASKRSDAINLRTVDLKSTHPWHLVPCRRAFHLQHLVHGRQSVDLKGLQPGKGWGLSSAPANAGCKSCTSEEHAFLGGGGVGNSVPNTRLASHRQRMLKKKHQEQNHALSQYKSFGDFNPIENFGLPEQNASHRQSFCIITSSLSWAMHF